MKAFNMPDPVRTAGLDTTQLRSAFLLGNLFQTGEVSLVYTDADRAVIGAAVPTQNPVPLQCSAELRADYFTERRELGVLNIGGTGRVIVDGNTYPMQPLDGLYVGRGSRSIQFASDHADRPAEFYFISYPAHTTYPTTHIRKADSAAVKLGSPETVNQRTIYKYIHPAGVKSCQLVMGFTQLEVGSAWNTMPSHTHLRRSEIYLYFNVPENQRVFHFMGQPTETRHLVVADKQAVISPSWSIHSGVGTGAYSFCWAMGGENQAFDDMDAVSIESLR